MSAHIRRLQAGSEDVKLAKFMIGKANMEGLTVANTRAYFHPLTVAVWVALSSIFVQYMGWWPNPEANGKLGYLSPVPGFVSMLVPFLALFDWIHRPYFEDRLQTVLHSLDFTDLFAYYSRSPASGFWICKYDDQFVGLLAVDASIDSESTAEGDEKTAKKVLSKSSNSVATIRHFYIEEKFRSTGIQQDLLQHAVKQAFEAEPKVKTIEARVTEPWATYLAASLRQSHFVDEGNPEMSRTGLQNCITRIRTLERETWQEKSSS